MCSDRAGAGAGQERGAFQTGKGVGGRSHGGAAAAEQGRGRCKYLAKEAKT